MNQQICSEFYRQLAMLKIWGSKKFGGLVPSPHLHWVLYGPVAATSYLLADWGRGERELHMLVICILPLAFTEK
jgi:hypothetical protein